MKIKHYYAIVLFSLASINLYGQQIFVEYDSFPIQKPRAFKILYQINHPYLNEISLTEKTPKAAGERPKKFLGNLTEGAFTLLTGFTTSSSDESIWVKEYGLIANNVIYNWQVQLYFPAKFEKTRERVKNDDGSTSVSTEKGIYVDWSKGGDGLIFEKGDTAGRFALITNFVSENEIQDWLARIDSDKRFEPSERSPYSQTPMNYNFALIGILKERSFSIISSGKTFRSVIFIENKPVAIFQGESNQIALGKKNKPSIYLLRDKISNIDHSDLFRLSMLIRLVTKLVAVDYIEK